MRNFYSPRHAEPVSFIRKKKVAGRVYKYEVENVRGPDGGVRQKVVRYLGPEEPVYGTEKERRTSTKRRV